MLDTFRVTNYKSIYIYVASQENFHSCTYQNTNQIKDVDKYLKKFLIIDDSKLYGIYNWV